MKLSKALAGVVAMSMISAPVVAQAAPADIAQARVGSEVEGEQLGGGFLIPLIAIVAIILGILAATGGDGDDIPASS